MTPITEDQVLSLMKGLEARERAAMKKLEGSVPASSSSGMPTARVMPFRASEQSASAKVDTAAEVVALAGARTARREKLTVHGQLVFKIDPALT